MRVVLVDHVREILIDESRGLRIPEDPARRRLGIHPLQLLLPGQIRQVKHIEAPQLQTVDPFAIRLAFKDANAGMEERIGADVLAVGEA